MRKKLAEFFYSPMSPAPLVWLRRGIAICLLAEIALLFRHRADLYGASALLKPALNDFLSSDPYLPRAAWFGLELDVLYGAYALSALWLLTGYLPRVAAALCCFLHVTFMTSNFFAAYGVDRFMHIALFYFIFMPTRHGPPSAEARFSLRVLQIHLSISYVAAGIEKILGHEWRSGEAIFLSMMLPDFGQWDVGWLAQVPWLAAIAAWGTLVLEILYVPGMWWKRTRPYWLAGICLLHAGIAVGLGLYLFSTVMIVLNGCLFATAFRLRPAPRDLSSPATLPPYAYSC